MEGISEMNKGLELDWEIADKITLASMKDHLAYLQKELAEHKEGHYMHPEDVYNSEYKIIPALETLIAYYGG